MDKRYEELEKKVGASIRLATSCSLALTVVLDGLAKQPNIDIKQLTNTINQALLVHQISHENEPDSVFSPSTTDYLMVRDMLRSALPDLSR